MRTTLFTGLALVLAGVALVLLGSGLDLDLESTALMGIAIGAVLALVPDRTPVVRIGSFVAGLVIAWIGYLIRTGLLPDTSAGRAVTGAIVLTLCVGVAVATLNRAPLWAVLLGAAALVGGYEAAYEVSPPEVLDTSVTALTTVLMTVAVGFLAAALVAPQPPAAVDSSPRRPNHDEGTTQLDDMMEDAR